MGNQTAVRLLSWAQEDHVPDNVQPAGIHEQRRDDGDPVFACDNVGRMTYHCSTNASPPINSSRKTTAFTMMIAVLTTGKALGLRDASDNGIIPPCGRPQSPQDAHPLQEKCPRELLLMIVGTMT